MSVESELEREIEETLADAEYMAHCGKAVEGLLKRALDKIRWVPVSEKLPEPFRRVLVLVKYGDSPAVACLDKDGDWVADTEHVYREGGWDGCVINSAIETSDVTHWRSID